MDKSTPPSESRLVDVTRTADLSAEYYLGKLAELGAGLAQTIPGSPAFFAAPLNIVQGAMGFTLSVVYRVANTTGPTLELEVVGVLDPHNRRPALTRGARILIDRDQPDPIFRNEAQAFTARGVSAVNVPGIGCDIAGYVSAGDTAANAYLLAGDFVGAEAGLRHVDVRAFEIATGLISALLMKAHFQHRADHDPLTGLLSSARIRTELEHALQHASDPHRGGLAIALVDADGFKRINDEHGHPAGDRVLESLGRVIASALRRDRDRAGRYGGDEFLLILEHTSLLETQTILERLRRAVEQSDADREIAIEPVTVSIGACLLEANRPLPSAADLLATADRALYAAKHAGRNRVELVSA